MCCAAAETNVTVTVTVTVTVNPPFGLDQGRTWFLPTHAGSCSHFPARGHRSATVQLPRTKSHRLCRMPAQCHLLHDNVLLTNGVHDIPDQFGRTAVL